MLRTSLPIATLLLAGCAGAPEVLFSRQQQAELDSLRIVSRELHTQVLALQDSLQFVDDIDTGYYYREKRTLENEVERLDFELGLCREGGRTVATLLADELFAPASATLTDAGRARLAELAADLRGDFDGQLIRIEGHTDSVPLGGKLKEQYPTNWELSAARATAVVRHLTEELEVPAGQVEAVAFGASQPVARNDTAEGRRLNRRVRIAAIPK